jgi:hypothetical protein
MSKSKVRCTGKYLLFEVIHKGIVYECMTSSDTKDLYACDPEPEDWVEIENVIRDAAWNLRIENLDEVG